MAKTLQEILSGVHISETMRKVTWDGPLRKVNFSLDEVKAPVHHLENVPGEPNMVRCACNSPKLKWRTHDGKPFDESKLLPHLVTCPECLAAMADKVEPDAVVDSNT